MAERPAKQGAFTVLMLIFTAVGAAATVVALFFPR